MPQKKQEKHQNTDTATKVITSVFIGLVGVVIIWAIVGSLNSSPNPNQTKADNPSVEQKTVADDVKKALDNLGKGTKKELASTSPGGYRGDIVEVKPDGKD